MLLLLSTSSSCVVGVVFLAVDLVVIVVRECDATKGLARNDGHRERFPPPRNRQEVGTAAKQNKSKAPSSFVSSQQSASRRRGGRVVPMAK